MEAYSLFRHRKRIIINRIIVATALLLFLKSSWTIWFGNPKCIAKAVTENKSQSCLLPWRFSQKDYFSVKDDYREMWQFAEKGFEISGKQSYLVGVSLNISKTERTNYCTFTYLFHNSSDWKHAEVTFNRFSFNLRLHISTLSWLNMPIISIIDNKWDNPFSAMEAANFNLDDSPRRASANIVYDASTGDAFWQIILLDKKGAHHRLLRISQDLSVEPTDPERELVSSLEFYSSYSKKRR